MATFRRRSGAWQALVRKKGFGQISRTFDTKADAEAWAKVTESEMVRGIFVSLKEAENTTLSEAPGPLRTGNRGRQKGSRPGEVADPDLEKLSTVQTLSGVDPGEGYRRIP